MNDKISDAESAQETLCAFVFSIKKFFSLNPDVMQRYTQFLDDKEPLIY